MAGAEVPSHSCLSCPFRLLQASTMNRFLVAAVLVVAAAGTARAGEDVTLLPGSVGLQAESEYFFDCDQTKKSDAKCVDGTGANWFSGKFVAGPGTPPSGDSGSYQVAIRADAPSNVGVFLGLAGAAANFFTALRIADIESLQYNVYRSSGAASTQMTFQCNW